MGPGMKTQPIIVLRLRPNPGVDEVRALRLLLKALLRRYGLRCLAATLERSP
jgi:hypothetical protein